MRLLRCILNDGDDNTDDDADGDDHVVGDATYVVVDDDDDDDDDESGDSDPYSGAVAPVGSLRHGNLVMCSYG